MRALTVVAVLLASGARSLCAQHGGQVEIGGFGSYTRYDSRFQLVNQFGVGAWLGYFLGDHFSLEVSGTVARPRSTFPGVANTTAAFASASLVMSSGGFYILGGYSRLHMGPGAPYASELNAIHAGLGQRIFFAPDHAAVRLEARAYYRGPGAGFGMQDEVVHFTGSVGMTFFVGPGGKNHRY
jgi:OprF membrane domain